MKIAMLGPTDTVHFRRLVRATVDRGHEVHVISMTPEEIEGATFERFAVPGFGFRYPYRWRKRWSAYLKDVIRRHDVVNVHFLSNWGITGEIAATGRLVATVYGSDVDHPPDTPAPSEETFEARRQMLRCADAVVVPSRWCANVVERFAGVDMYRAEVIPFGVDTDQFAPNRACGDDAGGHDRELIVGYFKGFEPVYGPMTMVEAAARVHASRTDVRFEFVGEGLLLDACKARAAELGVGAAIRWIGYQAHDSLAGILSKWSVSAISSVKESFCVAAIESAAMELPVVATDVGGLRESVSNGVTGILVRPNDPVAMADALLKLLADRDLRIAMGRAGRQRVCRQFEWRGCVDRWMALFERVCGFGPVGAVRSGRSGDVIPLVSSNGR